MAADDYRYVSTNDTEPRQAWDLPTTADQPIASTRLPVDSVRDQIEVSSRDSFPASDAPSWTPMRRVGRPMASTVKRKAAKSKRSLRRVPR